jgi:hypothetical protein
MSQEMKCWNKAVVPCLEDDIIQYLPWGTVKEHKQPLSGVLVLQKIGFLNFRAI